MRRLLACLLGGGAVVLLGFMPGVRSHAAETRPTGERKHGALRHLAVSANGVTYTGPRNFSGAAGLPPVVNDGRLATGYGWAPIETPIVMTFPKAVPLNEVEIVFHHGRDAWYQYILEGSLDAKKWDRLGSQQKGTPRGYQAVTFPRRPVRFLRLTVTKTGHRANAYHVVELAAHDRRDPRQPSAIRERMRGGSAPTDPSTDRTHLLLLRSVGKGAEIPGELARQLLGGPPGKRVLEDIDGDGDPDLLTFVDGAARHSARRKPILVRVIDDDDDMPADGEPDRDSDCYVADWNGDGVIDRVVDFRDEDGDGDADRTDFYSRTGSSFGDRPGLIVVRDIGDDDRMWHTRDYEYSQRVTQWLTDFNGDESFAMFVYDWRTRQWVSFFESPFTHHDVDGDGLAEVAVRCDRLKEMGKRIGLLRYSYDVDNDTDSLNRRDYDFSLNCSGRLEVPEKARQPIRLRGDSVTTPSLL